jgi:soluble lytic murein transglycosylase-like protein
MKDWGAMLRLTIIVWAILCVYCLCRAEQEQAPEPIEVEKTNFVIETPNEAIEAVDEQVEYYDIPLDHETQDLVRVACEESGIDMELALAVIRKETNFRNVMGDGGNSYGYMQIQPRWHKDRMERLGVTDLMNPADNFRVGCDFLAELLDRHALAYALTYYNQGRATVSEYSETVMDYMEELKP